MLTKIFKWMVLVLGSLLILVALLYLTRSQIALFQRVESAR